MSDPDEVRLEDRVRTALADALAGSDYLPSEGCILTDVVVVAGMIDTDGDHARVLFAAGAPWAARGLAAWSVDVIDAAEDMTIRHEDDDL